MEPSECVENPGFRIVSDLHLEFHQDSSKRQWTEVIPLSSQQDVLILAGDICTLKTEGLRKLLLDFLNWCRQNWVSVIYVPGNHEYYGLSIEQGNSYLQEICAESEVVLLNPGARQLGDITIIGATLWSSVPISKYRTIKNGVSDFTQIKNNTIEAHNKRFESDLNFIKTELNRLSPKQKVIVVTHFVPDTETAELRGSDLTTFFGTDVLSAFEPYKDRIVYWIYGHSHINRRGDVDGINLICNQVGYSWKLAAKDGYIDDLRL